MANRNQITPLKKGDVKNQIPYSLAKHWKQQLEMEMKQRREKYRVTRACLLRNPQAPGCFALRTLLTQEI